MPRLGDVVELAYGKSLPVRSRRRGSVPVYGSNGIVGWHDEALVADNTVVVGRKGSAGSVQLTTSPSFPIDTTYFVRPKPGVELDPVYAFFALKHLNLGRLRIETGVPGLNRTDAYREPFALPPLDEQRRIVAILNRAAKIERQRARAAERMGEFSLAVFDGMFGDPVENLRGWDVALLGEVIQGFEAGKNVMAGNGTTPLRILKVSAVTSGEFDPSMSKPAPDDYVAPKRHRVRVGDLLISRANTSDLVGATAMVEREAPDVLLPDKIWRFVWQADSPIEPRFVHGLFQNRATRGVISAMASGTSSSMKNISQAKLKKLRIIVPPLERQKRYAELVAKAREVECRAAIAGTRAEELSASLTTELLAKH